MLGGIFGKKKQPKIPSELKRLYDFQARAAEDLGRFARSAPLSDRLEQTQLANDRGQLGQQQAQQRDQLYSLYNPQTMRGSAPNLLTNVQNQQTGQGMALNAQHLALALQNRRQALLQASGIAANAAGTVRYQEQPSTDFAGTFGSLAQAMEQSRALKEARRAEETAGIERTAGDLRTATGVGQGAPEHMGAGNQTVEWNPNAAGAVGFGGTGGANAGYGDVQSQNPYANAPPYSAPSVPSPEAPFGTQRDELANQWLWNRQRVAGR